MISAFGAAQKHWGVGGVAVGSTASSVVTTVGAAVGTAVAGASVVTAGAI